MLCPPYVPTNITLSLSFPRSVYLSLFWNPSVCSYICYPASIQPSPSSILSCLFILSLFLPISLFFSPSFSISFCISHSFSLLYHTLNFSINPSSLYITHFIFIYHSLYLSPYHSIYRSTSFSMCLTISPLVSLPPNSIYLTISPYNSL